MSIAELTQAVRSAAAIRTRVQLQPAGGPGDKVFPPTYLGAKYAEEERVDPQTGQRIKCVLLDSVQSQANRMEDALQEAVDRGRIKLPMIVVDFNGIDLIDPVGTISSLQAPHRVADAILRDSVVDGKPFRQSDFGRSVDQADLTNATPLFEVCPTALLFGMWDSTGPKGGLGAKFARAIVSEIVGIDAEVGTRTSSRIDPLQIRAGAKVVKNKDGSWSVAGDQKAKGAISPSEINHGNIPPDIAAGGVTIRQALQTTVISLAGLRRLRFPVNGDSSVERDDAARAVLAALGLCAATLAAESGFDLRSRCLLWPEQEMTWEVLDRPGQAPKTFTLDSDAGIKLLNDAIDAATQAGLPWRTEPIVLQPAPNFAKLLQRSQELAATGDSEEG